MRARLPFCLILFAVALTTAPAAQAQDACTALTPCPWVVDVDELGVHGTGEPTQWNFTVGDWFVLNATNFDSVSHTLSLSGYGVSLLVPSYDEAQTAPFNFTMAGTFTLSDDAGHSATVLVTTGDVNDLEQGLVDESGNPKGDAASGTAGSNDIPSLPIVAVLGIVALAALLRRR